MRNPQGMDGREWWWVRTRHPRTQRFFLHHPEAHPGGYQNIRVYDREGLDWARLVWKVCHDCQRGVISKISLTPDVQRKGLGTLLIERALMDGHDYRWTTSSQSPDGQAFFTAMATRTGAEFTARARTCSHIRDLRHGWSKPVLDRHLWKAAGSTRTVPLTVGL
ncbi:hypothetical protein ACFYYI_34590 [Streptomyces sp. NPDC002387]|uniref:hypothetical protein n=1 Tax=unclassified Streptomyces TaxID=2593676 RepID=UPI0036AF0CC2